MCGGCQQQDVPYSEQLSKKQTHIETLFNHPARPIIPCDPPWHYRNKMEFSFSQNKAGDRFCGLIMKASRGKVFNLKECLIAPSWFATTLKQVYDWWLGTPLEAFHLHRGTGSLRTVTLRAAQNTDEKMVMLTVSSNPSYPVSKTFLKSFQEAVGDEASIFLQVHQAIKGQPTQFYEILLQGEPHFHEELEINGRRLRFALSPTSFFQPNTAQAQKIYTQALSLAGVRSEDHVLDLYAGISTLGLIFAPYAAKVTSVEINPHAVFDAKLNAQLNQISNLTPLCGDAAALLGSLSKVDIALVDPPRSGLHPQAVAQLEKLTPRTIVYISCNPLTQAADIAKLTSYRLAELQPIDQFPHTAHVENIALLTRKSCEV